jgi:hypothetical protein
MIDSHFFYDWKERSYTIKESVLEKVKTLKGKVEQSVYYDDMVKWDFYGTDEELQDLWITMQFLSMTAEPTAELVYKYNLTERKYLINLLRQLYLDTYNSNVPFFYTSGGPINTRLSGISDTEDSNSVIMGYKRPFGNSNVKNDVKEELEICGVIEQKDYEDEDYDDYINEYNYELELNVLKEFANFVMDFFSGGFELRWYSFEKPKSSGLTKDYKEIKEFWNGFSIDRMHPHMTQWKPKKSELRDIILNKLLTN